MKKFSLLIILFFTFLTFLKSQGIYPEEIFLVREFNNHKALMGDNIIRAHMPYSNILGSPYLYDEFIESEAISKDSIRYVNVKFRYNIFEDKLEYLNGEEVLVLTNPHDFSYFFLGQDVLFYQSYPSRRELANQGYFLLLTIGNKAALSKKINITYEPPKDAQVYTAAKKPEFKRSADHYFIKFEGSVPSRIYPNKRKVLKSFPDKKGELEIFIIQNQLNFKKEDDIIKLVKYYNSL
jgi:hypothetical protein